MQVGWRNGFPVLDKLTREWLNYLLSQKLTFLPEATNKAESHQAQDDTPLTMLSWTAHKVQTSLKILFRVWGKSRSVTTCKRIWSFRGEVYWCCLWTCRWTIWINIVQSSLSISRSKLIEKRKPPKPDKGIHSASLSIIFTLVILFCRSLHNALRDDEDVNDAKDDKGKRGDVDGKESTNLGGEKIYITRQFRFLMNCQEKNLHYRFVPRQN